MIRVMGFIVENDFVLHTENLANFEDTIDGMNKAKAFVSGIKITSFDSIEIVRM